MTHIEFNINWTEVGKAVGYMAAGVLIVLAILMYSFRNWRPY